ncbi:MAG: NADH-quinone oxidoreductase subunit NuoH [Deltaproteobacteria bacterium]|nr:NADH-quinone oxidoreductase subunit NuoH [Deltaproteobacteria bacterium]
MPSWWWLLIEVLVKVVLVLVPLLTVAALLTWDERKQSALMQDRLGPNRANIGPFTLWGLIHPIADTLKLFFKEDIVPDRADKLLHALAPILALAPSLIVYCVIPFGPAVQIPGIGRPIALQVADLDAGLLFIFAISSLAVFGVALAGWASNNKFSLLGALRASAQMFSYEIVLGLAAVGVIVVFGSVRMSELVARQATPLWGGLPSWGILVQPLGFVLFMVAALAELKRSPFDVPEGESEIVAGFWTEYSGMRWGMFYVAEFVEVSVLSGLLVALFFGGYHIPGVDPGWALTGHTVAIPFTSHGLAIAGWGWGLLMMLAFGLKVIVGDVVLQQIRWTFPRFRYDQVMSLGWKMLLPLALLNVLVTGAIVIR